jgi:hypothetical protein
MPLIADHLLVLPVEEVAWDSEGSSSAMPERLSRVRKISGDRLKETGAGRAEGVAAAADRPTWGALRRIGDTTALVSYLRCHGEQSVFCNP